MSVTVDNAPLHTETLGLRTVGQVLSHVSRDNRLVVTLLIDGAEPDLSRISQVKSSPVQGHTIYIETVEPRQMACDVLEEVERQMQEADVLTNDVVDLLQKNQAVPAMQKLGSCFTTWQNAQEAMAKTTELLRIDLERINIEGDSLARLFNVFTEQLKQIKSSLENRDYVTLGDVLSYEIPTVSQKLRQAIGHIRGTIVER